MDKQTTPSLAVLWQRLANFLETFDLIPLVIIVSVYHYYQALNSHDPFWVALPIALFVDLLQFRTVGQAVKLRSASWIIVAAIATLMAWALQFEFYSMPGKDGKELAWTLILTYSSLVPVGVLFMALLHESRKTFLSPQEYLEKIDALDGELQESRQQLTAVASELAKSQGAFQIAAKSGESLDSELREWKAIAEELRVRCLKLTQDNETLTAVEGELQQAYGKLRIANERLTAVEDELQTSKQALILVDRLSPLAVDILSLPESGKAQKQLAIEHGIPETTLSRIKTAFVK